MNYRILQHQTFENGAYQLVPIRFEDRVDIMQWRNEQIYHLRQAKLLTLADQDHYFEQVVNKLFDQEKPSQLLFSYLENGRCIGYGGLVHINWIDRHAEVSFIMDTKLEAEHFEKHWTIYLGLIKEVAYRELKLHKIQTYAFDIRKHLYPILEKNGFREEARLKEHCYFEESFIDVLIHSNFNHESNT